MAPNPSVSVLSVLNSPPFQSRLEDMDSGNASRHILSHTPLPYDPTPKLCSAINNEHHAAVQKHALDSQASQPYRCKRTNAAAKEQKIWVSWISTAEYESADDFGRIYFLRLLAAGVFARFPKTRIGLGHMGELFPYMMQRQGKATARWSRMKGSLGQVWEGNVWVTTSAPRDDGLYSVDYPFSDNETGAKFVREIEKQGLLRGHELETFVWGNAVELFGLGE
ncbi:hypothetical protein E2P81_ATG00159 [Venturia nashicola]|nr:hypothetical protein E2P81_ATG00159 [Venturia nashicola]